MYKLLEELVQIEHGMVLYCVVHSVVVLGTIDTAAVEDSSVGVEAMADDGVTVAIVMVRVVELVLDTVYVLVDSGVVLLTGATEELLSGI